MRFRSASLVVVVVAAVLAAGGAVGVPIGRARLQALVEERCARAVDGSCQVGALELARDGIVLRDLSVRFAPVGMSAHVHAIAVSWGWWALIRRTPQEVRVVADRVSVSSERSVADTVREFARLRSRRAASRGAAAATVRVATFGASGVELRAGLAPGLEFSLDGGSASWSSHEGLDLEWRDASLLAGEDASLHAGSCRVTRVDDTSDLSVRCDGPRAVADVTSVDRLDEATRDLVVALRGAVHGEDSGADGAAGRAANSSPRAEPSHVTLHARSGEVRLTRGTNVIAELSPAEFSADILGRRLESARVRLGGNSHGPDLDLSFERVGRSQWHVDLTGDQLPLVELARWIPAVPWHGIENGRVQMRVRAEPADDASGALVVDGSIALQSFGLFHAGLAHDPIDGLDLTVEGAARVDPIHRRIETEGIRVNVNGIIVAVAGWLERPAAHELALDASLRVPNTSCDGIRHALPLTVTGPVDELTFAGTIGADAHLALDTRSLATTQLQVDVDDQCAVVRDNMPLGIRRLRDVFVQRVTEPTGLRAFVTGPGSAAWVPLAQISPYVAHAVLTREDGRFYRHHGFDVGEIRGAIIRNVGARRFVYGASTLSMQLTKNIFLQREKTLVRKLQEVVLTWYLERSLDKDSILELYLNVVEFGPGIYGIGPAARFFFGREASELTPLQSIYLATLLPNPVARFSNYQRGGVSTGTVALLRNVARRMASAGYLSPSEFEFAQSESIVFRPENVPVHRALTQTVDASMSDEAAAALSPPPVEAVPQVPDPTSGGGAEEGTGAEPESGDAP